MSKATNALSVLKTNLNYYDLIELQALLTGYLDGIKVDEAEL